MKLTNDITATITNNAYTTNDAKLIKTIQDANTTWEALDTIASDENFTPTVLKTNKAHSRTDVSTIKANSTRRKQLIGWIKNEKELDSTSIYYELYSEELALLDAYAMNTLFSIYEDDNTILNYVASVQKQAEMFKSENRKKAAAKAALKRKATNAAKKQTIDEAMKARAILQNLIESGNIDPDIFNQISKVA